MNGKFEIRAAQKAGSFEDSSKNRNINFSLTALVGVGDHVLNKRY
jgi:hypothetical protein